MECKEKKRAATTIAAGNTSEACKTRSREPQSKNDNKIVGFILLDDQPICVVENVGFQRLVEHLEPRYQLPNRHAISDTLIPLKYKQVSNFISERLENAASVSFTTDI